MEGNRHIDRTDAVVRPVFQKEGNVYVRGKSGSGKTTLLLERLQFLAQEGVALKRTLNLVAYKEERIQQRGRGRRADVSFDLSVLLQHHPPLQC